MPRSRKPADPQVAAVRAAERRAAERAVDADPESWGLAPEIRRLGPNSNVTVVQGSRGKVLRARRQDIFGHLFSTGSLEAAQHRATERYMETVCQADGVTTHDSFRVEPTAGGGAAEIVTGYMVEASRRLARIEASLGRADLKLLRALVGPMLDGEVRVWRVLVKQITGETERHCQAAAVRRMAENLRLGWEELDAEDLRARRER